MNILVLCTGNSCRSQMAEGFFTQYLSDKGTVYSAGLDPQGVNPKAVHVMAELGIDISNNSSNHINEYLNHTFDYVITVCDNAAHNCPTFPGSGERLHWPFDDPAHAEGSDEEIMNEFRRVRDEIGRKITTWLKSTQIFD